MITILKGDCRKTLAQLEAGSVQMCCTSPPYWGLRSYLPKDHPDKALEIGQEKTPEDYVATMVEVFTEVWRVMQDDGTLWLNLGDSYATGAGSARSPGGKCFGKQNKVIDAGSFPKSQPNRMPIPGLKPKDLVGIPWRVAFALQSAGWYLRQWMPWVKRNAMPESVTDRPASACEIIFLLTKSADYYYDYEAVKLPASMSFVNDGRWETGSTTKNEKNGYEASKAQNPKSPHRMFDKQRGHSRKHAGFNERWDKMEKAEQCSGWRSTRNSDWFFEGLLTDASGDPLAFTVSPAVFKGAHFATFPPGLITPCILAGSRHGDIVLDPFGGSGTTAQVAIQHGRKAVVCELNDDYIPLIQQRTNITPGLNLP